MKISYLSSLFKEMSNKELLWCYISLLPLAELSYIVSQHKQVLFHGSLSPYASIHVQKQLSF